MNSNFQEFTDFLDPMCGSGTLVTEALMINTGTAPNIFRERFGFMSWRDFEYSLWERLKTEAKEKLPNQPYLLKEWILIEKQCLHQKEFVNATAW